MIVPIHSVATKKNIRNVVLDKNFDNLCTDIKEDGLLTPITVYEDSKDNYVIIAGHRRYAACNTIGKKNIDVKVMRPKPTDEQITKMQLNENLLRTDLSLFEEVMAFKVLADTSTTCQEIADKFGHSPKYVHKRLKLGNLVPCVLQPNILTPNNRKKLSRLADSHPKVQLEAIDHCRNQTTISKIGLVGWGAPKDKRSGRIMTRKEYLELYFSGDEWFPQRVDFLEYGNLSHNTVPKEVLIDICGSENKLREYEKEYGYKAQKTDSLFSEFVKTDYCVDTDFQLFLIEKCYPDHYQALSELKVGKHEQYDSGCFSGEWYDILNRSMLEDPTYITNGCASWNGDMLNPVIKMKPTGSDTKRAKDGNRPKYFGVAKKFGKVIIPLYVTYIRKNASMILNDKSLTWCNKYASINLKDLDNWNSGFKFHELIKKLPKKDRNDSSMFTAVFLGAYILECLFRTEVKHLSQFASANNCLTLKQWFSEHWTNSEEFRTNVLCCFTAAHLAEYKQGKGTKSNLVTLIATALNDKCRPFKFADIFQLDDLTEWQDYNSAVFFNKKQDYYDIVAGTEVSP